MRNMTVENTGDGQVAIHFDTDGKESKSFCFSTQNVEAALEEFVVKFGSGTRTEFQAVYPSGEAN